MRSGQTKQVETVSFPFSNYENTCLQCEGRGAGGSGASRHKSSALALEPKGGRLCWFASIMARLRCCDPDVLREGDLAFWADVA